jgi:TolB-like protein
MAGPIAVTTFVEIDNLYQSSTFGRILAEQLISELSMKGYNVVEIRLSDAVQIMESEGELGLSRQTDVLRPQQALSGLVVGTYAASSDRVYLNTRLIDPRSSNIISVGSVEMNKTKEISQLLRGNSFPSSLERIPVRHLSYQKAPMPYYFSGNPFLPNSHDQRSEDFAKKLMQEVPGEEQKATDKKEAYKEAELPPAK